jgi:hypothetical protein
MGYDPVTEDWIREFVDHWHPRARGWLVIFGDHISARWAEAALQASGRYTFPPIPIVKTGAAPRLSNDGPASQSEWMMVARPKRKKFMKWGSLRGWYPMQTVQHGHDHHGVRGAKSLNLMCAIVRDYSRPGDLVCDPCAGSGTTLLAAVTERRRAVGSEIDPDTYAIALKRLRGGHTPTMFPESEC